jgi:hypothetical protein
VAFKTSTSSLNNFGTERGALGRCIFATSALSVNDVSNNYWALMKCQVQFGCVI